MSEPTELARVRATRELERQARTCPEVRLTLDFLATATRGVVR